MIKRESRLPFLFYLIFLTVSLITDYGPEGSTIADSTASCFGLWLQLLLILEILPLCHLSTSVAFISASDKIPNFWTLGLSPFEPLHWLYSRIVCLRSRACCFMCALFHYFGTMSDSDNDVGFCTSIKLSRFTAVKIKFMECSAITSMLRVVSRMYGL